MIKIPDNDLTRRLKEAEGDTPEARKAHDTILADAWKQFTGPARDAFDYLLARLEAEAVEQVQRPNLTPDARQFAAGQLHLVYVLQSAIESFVNFNPDAENYNPQFGAPEDEAAESIAY